MVGITLKGTIRADPELEGGCAWIGVGSYELTLPPRYEVDCDRRAVIGPKGEIVASIGEVVTLWLPPASLIPAQRLSGRSGLQSSQDYSRLKCRRASTRISCLTQLARRHAGVRHRRECRR